MTRVYYSNLPPEAQEAIRKLTGESHEELESEVNKQPSTINTNSKKKQPQSLKKIFWSAFLRGFRRRGRDLH